MEAIFERKTVTCLQTALQQVQNGEQTMEIKLPEGMPDVFAAEDEKTLYSHQKQDQELTVAQIMNSLLQNSDLN